MAAKKSTKKSIKKVIVRRFESCFDVDRLDYKSHAKLVKPKAMLVGFVTAGVLYSALFFFAYWGMSNNKLPLEMFAKLVWIIMIPTTIMGFFAWQLAKNRFEFPIRQDTRVYIEELEAEGGLLWRFKPLLVLDRGELLKTDYKKAFSWSEQGKVDKLDIEDYTDAVHALNIILIDTESRYFSDDLLSDFNENFEITANAA